MDSSRPLEKKSTKKLEKKLCLSQLPAKVYSRFSTRIETSSRGYLRVKDILHFSQMGNGMPSVVLDLEIRVN